MKEVEIPDAAGIEDGTMKELKVGEGKKDNILIVRYKG